MFNYEIPQEDLPEFFATLDTIQKGPSPNLTFGIFCSACNAHVTGETRQMFEPRHMEIMEFHNQLHNLELREPGRLPKGNNK